MRKTKYLAGRLTQFIFLFVLLERIVLSQTEQAGITGAVVDSQGGGIAGAAIEVREEETMLVRTTRTTDSGAFFLGGLPIGTYSIEIAHPGFSTAVSKGIRLSVGQIRTVDTTLEVAGPSQELVVATRIGEIDRTTMSTGGTAIRLSFGTFPSMDAIGPRCCP